MPRTDIKGNAYPFSNQQDGGAPSVAGIPGRLVWSKSRKGGVAVGQAQEIGVRPGAPTQYADLKIKEAASRYCQAIMQPAVRASEYRQLTLPLGC